VYVKNNPENTLDPQGLFGIPAFPVNPSPYHPVDPPPSNPANPSSRWKFIGWEVEAHESFWVKYRILWARCQNDCTNRVQKLEALYQQWRPIQINVPTWPSDGPLYGSPGGGGSASGAIDSLFDLVEAIMKSKEGTEEDQFKNTMAQKGQEICDTLNKRRTK
jgi:hypothetical protein